MINEPGIYENIPAAEYHRDPAPEPSLSASTIDRLLERTPAHAKAGHPRLGTPEPEEFRHNLGEVVHTLLLGGQDICIIDETSYQKKDAREARDAALADDQLPVLRHQLEKAERVCDAIRVQINRHPTLHGVLRGGTNEASVFWREEGGIWCRCRPDILFREAVYDLKITGVAATPEAWGAGHAWRMGYARRAVWYRRGLRRVTHVMPRYHFIVVENEPPYGLSLFECSDEALDLATKEVGRALEIWTRCMTTGVWPGYSTETQWINVPTYAHYRSEEVLARHAMAGTATEFVMSPEGFGV